MQQVDRMPLVSVICATYNQEKYISECLDGILGQQTDFYFELIVHDDASTDATPDIIKEYAERYGGQVIPVFQTQNQWSRKVAIDKEFLYPKVRGKYVAICEGDDYWSDKRKLQLQVDYMESHPECVVCATECKWLIQSTGEFLSAPSRHKEVCTVQDFLENNQIYTLTTLSRASFAKEFQFEVLPLIPFFPMRDYTMWLYLLSKGTIVKLQDCTSVYRVLESSASHFKKSFEQMKFAMASYDIRSYFNDLMRYGVRSMIFKKWRDTYRYAKHMKRGISGLGLFAKCVIWMIFHPVPRPSAAVRNKVKSLNYNRI